MTGNVSLRELTKSDWQQLSELRLAALKECPGFFGRCLRDEQDQPPEFWQGWLTCEGKVIFGLFNQQRMVGFQGIAPDKLDSKAGVIWGSYIIPGYRGKGLSNLLYKACIDYAKATLSWKKVIVSHRQDNLSSNGANQHFGFKYTHTEPHTWHDGQTVDHVFYELDLEELRRHP